MIQTGEVLTWHSVKSTLEAVSSAGAGALSGNMLVATESSSVPYVSALKAHYGHLILHYRPEFH